MTQRWLMGCYKHGINSSNQTHSILFLPPSIPSSLPLSLPSFYHSTISLIRSHGPLLSPFWSFSSFTLPFVQLVPLITHRYHPPEPTTQRVVALLGSSSASTFHPKQPSTGVLSIQAHYDDPSKHVKSMIIGLVCVWQPQGYHEPFLSCMNMLVIWLLDEGQRWMCLLLVNPLGWEILE